MKGALGEVVGGVGGGDGGGSKVNIDKDIVMKLYWALI